MPWQICTLPKASICTREGSFKSSNGHSLKFFQEAVGKPLVSLSTALPPQFWSAKIDWFTFVFSFVNPNRWRIDAERIHLQP